VLSEGKDGNPARTPRPRGRPPAGRQQQIVPDGVFVDDAEGGAVRLRALPGPRDQDVLDIAMKFARQVLDLVADNTEGADGDQGAPLDLPFAVEISILTSGVQPLAICGGCLQLTAHRHALALVLQRAKVRRGGEVVARRGSVRE
jgi:hypothetical protein